ADRAGTIGHVWRQGQADWARAVAVTSSRLGGHAPIVHKLYRTRAFRPPGRASYSLSLARERVTRERGTLLGACRAAPDKSVSRGRAFRQDSCPGEKAPASMPPPLRACRPRLTASQGSEGQAQRQRQQPKRTAQWSEPLTELFGARAECRRRYRPTQMKRPGGGLTLSVNFLRPLLPRAMMCACATFRAGGSRWPTGRGSSRN